MQTYTLEQLRELNKEFEEYWYERRSINDETPSDFLRWLERREKNRKEIKFGQLPHT